MRLARSPDEIVVGYVIRCFETGGSFVDCLDAGSGCVVNGLCALKPALDGALDAFLGHLDSYLLSDLVPDRSTFMERLEKLIHPRELVR